MRISSPSTKSTSRSSAATRTCCPVVDRSRISIHSRSASHRATCSKAVGSKSAPRSRLSTRSTFLSNSAVTPRSSSYAATRRAGSLTRSVPSRKASPSPIVRRTSERNRARASGSRLPIVEPRKAISLRGCRGSSARCFSKSPTTGSTSREGNRSATAALASFSTAGSTSKGTKRRSVAASVSAPISSWVFSEVPLPSSTRVSAAQARAISHDVPVEDRALGPGRVVLLQPGDLVEELAAPGVVEVLRRQGLRLRGQPGTHVVGHLRGQRARVEVDLRVQDGHQLSRGVTVTWAVSLRLTSSRCRSGTSTQRASSS